MDGGENAAAPLIEQPRFLNSPFGRNQDMIQGAQGKAAQVEGGPIAVRDPGQPACEHPLHPRPMGGAIEITRHELRQIDLAEPLRQQIGRPHLGEGMELQM